MANGKCFIDIGFFQQRKEGEGAPGDVFVSSKTARHDRTVCVLSDGLGSGVKANVLATLTATMAMKFVSADIEMQAASKIIMSTLPICSKRKIAYSTFTIMDINDDGSVKIMEYENPTYLLYREDRAQPVHTTSVRIPTEKLGDRDLSFSGFSAVEGDRIVVSSDGITQSGLGTRDYPLGWSEACTQAYIGGLIAQTPDISARSLARKVVCKAHENDGGKAKDDISCAVVYFRKPRQLMVMTGPPIHKENDAKMARMVDEYPGTKVVCGGTSANIIARELERAVSVDLSELDPHVPPASRIDGIDLVTEGTLTLSRVADLLDKRLDPDTLKRNAATRLLSLFLESDVIQFIVGTKINEAHQDPNLPAELDIRRNLIRRIVDQLKDTYLKDASFQLI
jgi:hypothetical protein